MNGIKEGTCCVTFELHDAQLKRLEALIERNLARQEAIAANMRTDIGELKSEMGELRGEIKAVHAKIDGLEDSIALTNMRINDLKNQQSNTLARWGIMCGASHHIINLELHTLIFKEAIF